MMEIINSKKKLSEEDISLLKVNYPNIPDDYIEYLKSIGAGNIGDCTFKVMDSLYNFSDIGLDDVYKISPSIKFFGDNFSGDFAGFDLSNTKNEVVEFWHDSGGLYYTDKTFREYIIEYLLIGENKDEY